ncbi:MAG TPA: Holliday junction branch migration DNA helicase RuvB [Firmicutes bacterium]|nr:Holliday junction branch migration DNA helicase RuvB [Bacillota bacterium]
MEERQASRVVSPEPQPDDTELERSLRPRTLRDYVGQTRIKQQLEIYIRAALERGDPLDHVLLYGPPGLGKTTLAHVISHELGVGIRVTSGPAIERPGDMVAILTNLEDREVLFIDEIHRLNRIAGEALYPAMEDFLYDWVAGKGPSARTYRIKLPRFTLVGATTRAGLIASPLRDRFGITVRLEYYTPEELACIIRRSAGILNIDIDEEGVSEISRRSRGTPRVANRLLKRLRDFAQVRANGVITGEVAREGLELLEIDDIGLDVTDREMLKALILKYGGGPVGIDALAASISEEPETVEDVYEPYLLQIGFLRRTPRGRMATPLAYAHMNVDLPEESQRRLV